MPGWSAAWQERLEHLSAWLATDRPSPGLPDDGPPILLIRGDITHERVDAVVNAANTALRPGGGVDGAITRAAGPEALAERQRLILERDEPPLTTGDAVATAAGDLPARWIIHTAGPVFADHERDRVPLLRCHLASLAVADHLGARTVAFPAISCGVYGYPPVLAAPVAIAAVTFAPCAVSEVRFVLFEETTMDAFSAALANPGRTASR